MYVIQTESYLLGLRWDFKNKKETSIGTPTNPHLYLHSLLGKGVDEETNVIRGIDSRCSLVQKQSREN